VNQEIRKKDSRYPTNCWAFSQGFSQLPNRASTKQQHKQKCEEEKKFLKKKKKKKVPEKTLELETHLLEMKNPRVQKSTTTTHRVSHPHSIQSKPKQSSKCPHKTQMCVSIVVFALREREF
jgi:hypothetical protein